MILCRCSLLKSQVDLEINFSTCLLLHDTHQNLSCSLELLHISWRLLPFAGQVTQLRLMDQLAIWFFNKVQKEPLLWGWTGTLAYFKAQIECNSLYSLQPLRNNFIINCYALHQNILTINKQNRSWKRFDNCRGNSVPLLLLESQYCSLMMFWTSLSTARFSLSPTSVPTPFKTLCTLWNRFILSSWVGGLHVYHRPCVTFTPTCCILRKCLRPPTSHCQHVKFKARDRSF